MNDKELLREWNREASTVCPGSEFVDDPKRVFARVRESQQAMMQSIIGLQRRIKELETPKEIRK